jgi:hypothetical protein
VLQGLQLTLTALSNRSELVHLLQTLHVSGIIPVPVPVYDATGERKSLSTLLGSALKVRQFLTHVNLVAAPASTTNEPFLSVFSDGRADRRFS